jgi:peroxiredoxin
MVMAGLLGLGSGAAAPAKIGDPAAPLTIKEWIKGMPVDVKDGKHIYVIEFWQTLSKASVAAIPKLNELQKKFKNQGVVILGISDDPADKLRDFVGYQDVAMTYGVAADDKRTTARAYMVAFGKSSIPYAFVIGKDGKVLWHGHPLYGLEKALEAIVAGSYNLELAIKRDTPRAELDEYLALSRAASPRAGEAGRKLLAARTNSAPRLEDMAYRIITDVHNKHRDFTLATQALDQAEHLSPTNSPRLVMARGLLLFETGKAEEGLTTARRALGLITNDEERVAFGTYVGVMEARLAEKKKAKEEQEKGQTNAPPAVNDK